MQPKIAEAIPIFKGSEHDVQLPSRLLKIRESNGNDDDTLSRMGGELQSQADNLYRFLADITEKDFTTDSKPTPEEIKAWPANDKFGLLFKQRLINHGSDLEFEHECMNPLCKDESGNRTVLKLTQDLEEFNTNLKTHKNVGTRQKLGVYPIDQDIIEYRTSSGKNIRYKRLNGVLELKQLDMPISSQTQNYMLILRELELYSGTEWIRMHTFHSFSSREMAEIRKHVTANDTIFDPEIQCQCHKCRTPFLVPMFNIPAFFFPVPSI